MKKLCLILCLVMVFVFVPSVSFADTNYCATIDQVIDTVLKCSNQLMDEFVISYPAELEAKMTPDNLNGMIRSTGIGYYYYNFDREKHTVWVGDLTYRSGFKIARSVIMGDYSRLNEKERSIMMQANGIVERAKRETSNLLDLEKYLHDEICRMTVYTQNPNADYNDETEVTRYDTAEGVFIYGCGECDAYADAFYMLASMAGFEVGMQSGDTSSGKHVWNVINIYGGWYGVDVTWDDPDSSINNDWARYIYMNMGYVAFADTHWWNEEMSAHELDYYMDWGNYIYDSEQYGVYYEKLSDMTNYVAKCVNQGQREFHVMVDGNYSYNDFFDSLKNGNGINKAWNAWAYDYHIVITPSQDYTCFDVFFYNM